MPTGRQRCDHILDAINAIDRETNGFDLQTFLGAPGLQDACCFRLLVIGEAANALLVRHAAEIAHHTPGLALPCRNAKRMRDRLAHHYHRIDPLIVWNTIKIHVPQLIADVQALRNALP
ncbi:DUF86 domain-containing protein [Burkholderia pseudomallei]|uniref:HepT-like ribonuclease domain-containing protein n=1 Tax=Burkholderia pseudomallei TaxID=28450 RepID=UPI000DC4697D|nr:DUF86 domain-containing protein [Burkholderia pseudomallei]MXN58938.1 DUF86 domain-containing protein [Burkholderia pseudomallei]RAP80189.1 hypothetical protein DPQ97_31655 [Burkholderia pseudomallei]RAP81019.1 hypothetical protein DPR01_33025 [Burkholderia pseudomallei]RAP87710.1 hypothetical protein DPQ99_30560 [Burkholderia pseudomallei]